MSGHEWQAKRTAFLLNITAEPEIALAVCQAAASHKFRKAIWVIFEGRDCRANQGRRCATWPGRALEWPHCPQPADRATRGTLSPSLRSTKLIALPRRRTSWPKA